MGCTAPPWVNTCCSCIFISDVRHPWMSAVMDSETILTWTLLCAPQRVGPLHCAAWFGHSEVVRLLVKRGAPVNARDKKVRYSLWHAGETPSTVCS